MEMRPVSSSQLDSVGYDSPTQTLHIQFKNGKKYSYEGVPRDIHQQLMNSHSHGGFFHKRIRPVYKGQKQKS